MITLLKICLLVNMAFVAWTLVPANAQQPTPTPAQTAIQIDNVVNQWAQTIEALQRENADLKKKLEEKTQSPTDAPK